MTQTNRVLTLTTSAGLVDYRDTGGGGPVVVLLHGVLMNHTVWDEVVDDLAPTFRCVVPTLPLGAHRHPMRPDADLSIDGIALLVAELLDRLDLKQVTLAMNDWGGPQLLVAHRRTERIARLVLVACEAFDNFPPAGGGQQLARVAATPGGFGLPALLLRIAAVRRAVAGSLAKHPVPDERLREWFGPFAYDRGVRRDLRRYCRSVPIDSGRDWSADLAEFTRPALVVWATEDRMMPAGHGRRLVERLPDARLVEIADSFTVVPVDQPRRLAAALRAFVTGSGPTDG